MMPSSAASRATVASIGLIAMTFTVAVMLGGGLAGCASGSKGRSATTETGDASADPYLWLEEIESPKAIDWVRERNARAEASILAGPAFKDFEADIRKVVLAPDRLPLGALRAGYVYNFWQDDTNIRGLWRRATLAEYARPQPNWEPILDLDKLAADEKENWVWKGATCLAPEGNRCLLSLSRGGKDASVVREFDVVAKAFVKDGFQAPEAKWRASWIDHDTLWFGTDFGPGTMTKSGYPRQTRLWKRGEAYNQAKLIYEAKPDDLWAQGISAHRPEGKSNFIVRGKDFYSAELFRVGEGMKLEKVPVPEDARFEHVFKGQIFFALRSAWKGPSWEFPEGALIALSLNRLDEVPELVYAPGPRSAFVQTASTKSELIIGTLDNVHERAFRARRGKAGWTMEPLRVGKSGVIFEVNASDDFDDRVLAYETGFVVPPSVLLGNASDARPSFKKLRSLPARFDASNMVVEQRDTKSKDGERIPYFIVRPRSTPMNGSVPTLLYAYGGFESAMTPEYVGAIGKMWIEKRKAIYVLANIRGGGEFGPRWHKAALQENRQRAFDDFQAVAEDLIARKVTSPGKLGIMGGSNGGLLVGTSYVQRPDLFGAVVCQVPLLDMLRYHKLLAGFSWIAEYGNPDEPKMGEALARYSPYQNAKADGAYPPILFLTSTKDDRVHPGHARKMMAKLEGLSKPALLWENIEGGHGGAANLEQRVKFSALGWTFLWKTLSTAPGPKLKSAPGSRRAQAN